jgi:16S rRNA (uracil1498-N3)-methyltransferase
VRRRFFVEGFTGGGAVISGDTAHHLGRVLRAQAGQLYELSDGRDVWLGRIESVERDRVAFALLEQLPSYAPPLDVTLALSIIKFDPFEWAIEKATELGVSTIVPLAAGRSEKSLIVAGTKRVERWKKILAEASQQSRRVRVPVLEPISSPEEAFSACKGDAKMILSERADAPSLRAVLGGKQSVPSLMLAVGPEGGWTEKEFAAARSAGFREASLGRLILRAETAVIAALAAVNFALGA